MEGGFISNSYLLKTNSPVKNIHTTFPSNGRSHITISELNGNQTLLFTDKVIIKQKNQVKDVINNKNDIANKLKSMEKLGLLPFGLVRDVSPPFSIINASPMYELLDFVFVAPLILKAIGKIIQKPEPEDFCIDIDEYPKKIFALEVFISKTGISSLNNLNTIAQKVLDKKKPPISCRLHIMGNTKK